MELDVAKFVLEIVVLGLSSFVGVRVALATLNTKVAHLEKCRQEDRTDHKDLSDIVYEHGDRIAVVESKVGIRYRSIE